MGALQISFSNRATRLHSPSVLLLGAALLLSTAPASRATAGGPAELATARARFADLDFEGALAAFQAVATDAGTKARVRAAALTGQGLCQQVLGRPKEARASFLESLAIDPRQRLPDDTSPKLRRPFTAARQDYQKNYAPKLSLDRAALPSGSVVIRTQDALGLIDSVEILLSAGKRPITLKARNRGDGSFEARPEESGRGRLRVTARNRDGLEIAWLGSPKPLAILLPAPEPEAPAVTPDDPVPPTETVAAVVPPVPPPDPPQDDPPPPDDTPADSTLAVADAIVDPGPGPGPDPDLGDPGFLDPEPGPSGGGSLRPLAYGLAGGTAAALGGAIALGLSAKAKETAFYGDPSAFASQIEALETGRTARNHALGSNLLFGGAALLAGGAALFYFWSPGASTLAVAPTGDGAVAVFSLTLP